MRKCSCDVFVLLLFTVTSCGSEGGGRWDGVTDGEIGVEGSDADMRGDSDGGDFAGESDSDGVEVSEACSQPGTERSCYPGDPAEVDVGICRSGTQRCEGAGEFATWGPCLEYLGKVEEVCWDDLDNDCDHETDEDCECSPPCTSPPSPTCDGPCRSMSYDVTGTCDQGECAYPSYPTDCELGCQDTAGRCRTSQGPLPACEDAACGTPNGCGGTCETGSGCCTETTYTVSSGFTANGTTICCTGTDTASAVIDCGDGDDHWVSPSGTSCGTAYEGPENYGGPCVSLTCLSRVCD